MERGLEHAMACATYGDCAFDEAMRFHRELDARWKSLSAKWLPLLEKATVRGWFGLGEAIDLNWVLGFLFGPTKAWPKGLSNEEVQILRLARAAATYKPLAAFGYGALGISDKNEKASTINELEETFRLFAQAFKREIALKMWARYDAVSDVAAVALKPKCEEIYGEACSLDDSRSIFQGDLERGLKVKTLNVSPEMYRVLPEFLAWISV